MDEVADVIDYGKAAVYRKTNFSQKFDEFDDSKSGYLTKGEMAKFIKIVFNDTSVPILKEIKDIDQMID